MNLRQIVGEFGESLAADYLIRKKYKIVDVNVKISHQEVDIIAKKESLFVFIEVKTRANFNFGSADEAMTSRKIKNLKKIVGAYVSDNNLDENLVRYDFISIDIDKEKKIANLKHYKGII
ncbi:MAG: YraN family protein [Patescibacteria group bacterium]